MLYLTLSLVVVSLAACTTPEQARPSAADTQRMAERLQQIAHNQNPVSNIYLNDLRVEHFSRRQELLSPLARMRARILLARERLRAGQTQASIDEFQQLRPELEKRRVRMEPSLDMLLGLAYLRLGEQVNCLEGHTTASCLFPIGPDGVHADPRGSRTALVLLGHCAGAKPRRFDGSLAPQHRLYDPRRIPRPSPTSVAYRAPALFAAEYDIGHFPDIAPFLRLDLVSLAGGSIMDDFDNDGFLDLMISAWGLHDQLRYFRKPRRWHVQRAHAGSRSDRHNRRSATGPRRLRQRRLARFSGCARGLAGDRRPASQFAGAQPRRRHLCRCDRSRGLAQLSSHPNGGLG